MSLDSEFDSGTASVGELTELFAPGVAIPTIGIVASELFLYTGHVSYALYGHLVTFLVCTLAPFRFDGDSRVFHVFALIPIFRLVNLGMPVFFELTLAWYPFIYGPIILGALIVVRADRRRDLFRGWTLAALTLPVTIPVSAVLASVEYRIIQPGQLIPVLTAPQLLFIGAVMLLFVGFGEELLYRGLLQRTLVPRIGTWPAILLASALFGLMHSVYGRPEELLFAGGIGLLYGVIYNRTDNLLVITVLHGLLNVFLFGIFPFYGSLSALVGP